MDSSFLGEFLILILLIFNCSRMFFLKYGKVDTLTVLAPVCVVLSVLQIIAWNADIFSIILLIISILCFFINFRALLRFVSGLYVDHYSIAFKIGALFVLVLSFIELGFLIYFKPVIIKAADYNVKENKIRIAGSFNTGFYKADTFGTSDGVVTICEPERIENYNHQIIIIIPDKRADSVGYAPYTYILAKMGYKVYIADFYSNEIKWFHSIADIRYFRKLYTIYSALKNPISFEGQKEFYSFNTMKETEAMLKFVVHNEGGLANAGEPFFIGDWMSNISLKDFAKMNEKNICGFLNLSAFEEYKTVGFGFVEQNNPLVAYKFGLKRNKNLTDIVKLAENTRAFIPVIEELESETKENINDIN